VTLSTTRSLQLFYLSLQITLTNRASVCNCQEMMQYFFCSQTHLCSIQVLFYVSQNSKNNHTVEIPCMHWVTSLFDLAFC